jgi:raffinose/stachyose/melibiose transport system substrate-binding protein
MKDRRFSRGIAVAAAAALALGVTIAGAPAQAATTITWLTDSGANNLARVNSVIKAFQAKNPTIKVKVVTRPGGSTGDNLVKTKLATGTMSDVFDYNSGALVSALNPARTMLDVSKEAFWNNVYPSFKPAVTVAGKQYGAPFGTAGGGALYYNTKVLAAAGVTSVPKTWNDFIAASQKIKATGVDAICGSFADSWSAQLLVLADYFNVQAGVKNFAADYSANKAKFAYVPQALASFTKMEQTFALGLYNKNAATTKYSEIGKLIGSGKCGFYPMGTWFTQDIPAENANEVGLMNLPGTSAKSNGLTVWMPSALYIAKSSKNAAAAKKLQAFVVTKAGTDAWVKGDVYSGPFMTKDQSAAPASVPLATKNLATLMKGASSPALEYISPIKGPHLDSICVQVLTGQVSAKEGAALYDKDVAAQAQQLGIKGW